MGVNLDVLIGHRLDAAAVLDLPHRLREAPGVAAALADLAAVLQPRWPNLHTDEWLFTKALTPDGGWTAVGIEDAWTRDDTPVGIEAAAGFSFIVG
jgi:hypothetical protein